MLVTVVLRNGNSNGPCFLYSGEFTFTVGVTATNQVGSGWRVSTTVANFEYDVTITVAE